MPSQPTPRYRRRGGLIWMSCGARIDNRVECGDFALHFGEMMIVDPLQHVGLVAGWEIISKGGIDRPRQQNPPLKRIDKRLAIVLTHGISLARVEVSDRTWVQPARARARSVATVTVILRGR